MIPHMPGRKFRQSILIAPAIAFVMAAAAVMTGASSRASDPARPLPAAASGDHAWFVVPTKRDEDRHEILHHALSMAGPYFGRTLTVSREPEAMAAYDRRLWLIMPSHERGQDRLRETFSLTMEREPGLDFYRPSPRDRLQIEDALPGWGRLAGVVGTKGGPLALVMPPQFELLDRDDEQHSEAAFRERARPQLLLLRGGRWQEQELPPGLGRADRALLGAAGDRSDQPCILVPLPGDATRSILHQRSVEGDWRSEELPIRFNSVRELVNIRGRIAALLQEANDEPPRLAYLRPESTLELAELTGLRGRWAIVGMRDGARLIEYSTQDDVSIRRIDAITGALGPREAMRLQPLPAGRLWHVTFLLLTALLAVLLVLLVRPGGKDPVTLPAKTIPLPAGARIMALVMDMVPAGVFAALFLRVGPTDLLRLPMMTDSWEQSAPFLVMACLMVLHSAVAEMITGTSLGKVFVGGRVVNAKGEAASIGQVAGRNAMKLLILMVPPLAIFALLNPNLQGFHDLLARTVVVRPILEEQSGDPRTDERS